MLALARLHTESLLTPRSAWSLTERVVTFTTTVRVVHCVHRDTEHLRAATHPADAACLTNGDQVVFWVGNRSDRCCAFLADTAHFGAWKLDDGEVTIDTNERCGRSGGADDLAAATRVHLDVEDLVSDRDELHLHAVARLHLRALAGNDLIACLHALRSQNVALLAVHVVNQRDACRAVWIVFQCNDRRRNVHFVRLAEVDVTEQTLVSSTAVADGDAALAVATGNALLTAYKALLRALLAQIREVGDRHLTSSRSRWFSLLHRHDGLENQALNWERSMALLFASSVTTAFLNG